MDATTINPLYMSKKIIIVGPGEAAKEAARKVIEEMPDAVVVIQETSPTEPNWDSVPISTSQLEPCPGRLLPQPYVKKRKRDHRRKSSREI